MRMLRPGDAVTHSFLGFGDGVLESSGAVIDGMKEAQARGVVIDVGHGAGGVLVPSRGESPVRGRPAGNDQQRPAHRQYRRPRVRPRHHPVQVHASGHVPRRGDQAVHRDGGATIGQGGRLGTLRLGSHGDVTILRIEEGRFTLRDRLSTATSLGRTRWEPPHLWRRPGAWHT